MMGDLAKYIGNEIEFPILREWDFFNHAGVAPIPRVAADAMRKFAYEAATSAYVGQHWYRDLEALRKSAAAMINAAPQEIALLKNTSEGIATVANGLGWHAGDRIVTTNVEYSANIYPWMDLAKRVGIELVMVAEEVGDDGARHVPIDKLLQAAEHDRTRMISLSHVEFASGQRHDLARIGQFCREREIIFNVDAIQSLGIFPVDVRAMNIDYLSADGHKWMLGPEGAGIFFCRRELLGTTRPPLIGWMNVINDQAFGTYDFTLKSDARKFECGSHNLPGFLALKASIELLRSLDGVAERIKLLSERLIAGLRAKAFSIVSPRSGDQWSGIVSFTSAKHDHQQIWRNLRENHHTEIALREGRLRASPHFYNTEQQIDRLIEHLPSH